MKVLLADDDANRARDLAGALAADPGIEIVRTRPGELLADMVRDHAPDLILIDMERPDRDVLERLRRMSMAEPRPIVMFVDNDDPGFMEEAIGAGVCSYNVLDLPPPDIKPILRAAVALFRRHQSLRQDLSAAEARLHERGVVDRAKAILMRRSRLSEPEAHRWLQKNAMGAGRRLQDVAEELVRADETNPAKAKPREAQP